jgi:oxygen-dependent protoporphyrinogen oxidase
MNPYSPHVAIIGGGIAGLATAYYLQQKARQQQQVVTYSLIESAPKFGGKIATKAINGLIIEGGPDSFISQKPWALELCRELGLADRLIGMDDRKRKTFILNKGRLHPLPDGVLMIVPTKMRPFVLSPLLSPWGKLRMGLDLFIPPRRDEADESLADFINRRLGREALEKMAEPLLAGIYVADPERLSIQSTFPRFSLMEKKYGSLIKAILGQKQAASSPTGPKLPLFMTLRGGLGELVGAIVDTLEGDLLSGRTVTRLDYTTDRSRPYRLQLAGGRVITADAVVLATPAHVAANLLEPQSPALAQALRQIRYLSTATLSLAFKRSAVAHPLDGFGFVVPKREDSRLLACSWVSTKFSHRAPADQVLLRAFVGGYRHQDLVARSDQELLALVRAELAQIMGIRAEPTHHEIYRWPQGNAQYDVGHLDRLRRIEQLAAETHPGLYFTGSAYRGVGLPDCIHEGQGTAANLLTQLKAQTMSVISD